MSDALFVPTASEIEQTRLHRFLTTLRDQGAVPPDVESAHDLQRWSAENPEVFWAAIWREAQLMADGPGAPDAPWRDVLHGAHRMAPPDPEQGPTWFTETRLNFAEHLLRRRDDTTAIVAWNELGRHDVLTFRQLVARVGAAQRALMSRGVKAGDRIAGWLPNVPDAVVMMLATSSLGAIWSSCSPDFGTQGVLDRFAQITPRILIAAAGYRYAGKDIDCVQRLQEIVAALPSLEETWIVDYHLHDRDVSGVPSAAKLEEVLSPHFSDAPLVFERMPFDHPLYIMYSSGTTGLPKCMVHGAGGTLVQHWKELALHTDIDEGDVVFYFTTCGWMMWNWLASVLALDATIVLFDGAPLAPDASILWKMAEAERISVFGTSAKYLGLLEKEGVRPREQFNLGALRTVLSTGSPLAAHSFDFVYRDIKPRVRLASISGGTDIISCFAGGDPTGTVYRGELQMRALGMSVDVFDESGAPVRGRAGELVCTKPFPSMPVAFWNDPDGAKYRAAYFEYFPNVWRHGDWAEITPHDGMIIHGRSDSTLNPGGVRIGTAEIYRQVEQVPQVVESVVIEQQFEDGDGRRDSRVVLFVRLRDELVLDDALVERIRQQIRRNASPHHVPRVIVQVADIPRTVSGKISEVAVRDVVHGRRVTNADALANPGALGLYDGILKDR